MTATSYFVGEMIFWLILTFNALLWYSHILIALSALWAWIDDKWDEWEFNECWVMRAYKKITSNEVAGCFLDFLGIDDRIDWITLFFVILVISLLSFMLLMIIAMLTLINAWVYIGLIMLIALLIFILARLSRYLRRLQKSVRAIAKAAHSHAKDGKVTKVQVPPIEF